MLQAFRLKPAALYFLPAPVHTSCYGHHLLINKRLKQRSRDQAQSVLQHASEVQVTRLQNNALLSPPPARARGTTLVG
jgi:GH24 family phage-related lysozyme (muramidase)